MVDIALFLYAWVEVFNEYFRFAAGVGGIVVMYFTIRKLVQEYKVKEIERQERLLNIEKLTKELKKYDHDTQ